MLKPRQRWIYFYRFNPTIRTERVTPPTALDFMNAIWTSFVAGTAYSLEPVEGYRENRRVSLKDLDIDEERNVATLLFAIGDPELSDPIFENLTTGELRPAGKREREGVSFAAHMIINLDMDPQGTYSMLLEQIPYLSRTTLVPFMKRLVRESGFEFEKVDENGETVRFTPSFQVDGDMSQRLQEEIEHGELSDIILVRNRRMGAGLDEDGFFHEASRQIKLKVDKDANNPKPAIIQRAYELARRENMEEMRVRYTRDDEKSRTIAVRTNNPYDFGDAVNVRIECLDFDYDLPNSRDNIDQVVKEEMSNLLE